MKKIMNVIVLLILTISMSACVIRTSAPRAYWVPGHYNIGPHGGRYWVQGHRY